MIIKQTTPTEYDPSAKQKEFFDYFNQVLLPEFKEITSTYQALKSTKDPKQIAMLLEKVDMCMEKFEEPPTFGSEESSSENMSEGMSMGGMKPDASKFLSDLKRMNSKFGGE
jgi:5'-deoxynucleotidase YfbR-like HD superfamily hydrolase